MRHPVYPFRLILKELRRDAGLAVLAAAEATEYGNYERWESGPTRVGAQYLRTIARAFGVTDELWLLLYAWLVDRWTPAPGERAVDLARVNPSRVLRDLPVDKFAADTTATNLVLGSSRHLDVALLCLDARYQRGKRVVLMPVRRSSLPDRGPGESVLQATYGDVDVDGLRRVSRALFARGRCGVESPEYEEPDLGPNMAPVLTSPEAFEVLADELTGPLATEARWFAGMLRTQQQTLRAMLGAARQRPFTSIADTHRSAASALRGPSVQRSSAFWRAAIARRSAASALVGYPALGWLTTAGAGLGVRSLTSAGSSAVKASAAPVANAAPAANAAMLCQSDVGRAGSGSVVVVAVIGFLLSVGWARCPSRWAQGRRTIPANDVQACRTRRDRTKGRR